MEKAICEGACFCPHDTDVSKYTDKYFTRTMQIVEKFGDVRVKYAVFMRRPVLFASKMAVDWLKTVANQRNADLDITFNFKDGDWVGAGEPMMYYEGSFAKLSELETLFLQKLGACCVAAYNAYRICKTLPKVAFLAMDARHCAGLEMSEHMAYAASVGSKTAKKEFGAVGFVGNANDFTAHYFGNKNGMGTMPHALIGYAGSTLKAAEMYNETFPEQDLTVLVDYFGQEVTDALAVCNRFPELAKQGKIGVRIDTHGGRFVEGLDTPKSYAVLDRNAPQAIKAYRSENELKHLIGTGVTAAAIWHMRENLDANGFDKVKIIASSGFSPEKCKVMEVAKAPVDVIGTGSFLPSNWNETYATADIISYDGKSVVKKGREFLLKK